MMNSNIESKQRNNSIKIRAHHLLCIQGFQGYGYSQEFVHYMNKVVKYLESHLNCKLQIVKGVDVICAHCPHQNDGFCDKDCTSNSLEAMDNKIIKKLNIKEGHEDKTFIILKRVNEIFKTKLDIKDICGNCSWKFKCSWFLSRD